MTHHNCTQCGQVKQANKVTICKECGKVVCNSCFQSHIGSCGISTTPNLGGSSETIGLMPQKQSQIFAASILSQLHTVQTAILSLGSHAEHLEKKLHGLNLWIHRLNEKMSQIELKQATIERKVFEDKNPFEPDSVEI